MTVITWGAEDLSAALGASDNMHASSGGYDDPYLMAKSLCLAAARALDVQPVGVVYVNYQDMDGLSTDCLNDRNRIYWKDCYTSCSGGSDKHSSRHQMKRSNMRKELLLYLSRTRCWCSGAGWQNARYATP